MPPASPSRGQELRLVEDRRGRAAPEGGFSGAHHPRLGRVSVGPGVQHLVEDALGLLRRHQPGAADPLGPLASRHAVALGKHQQELARLAADLGQDGAVPLALPQRRLGQHQRRPAGDLGGGGAARHQHRHAQAAGQLQEGAVAQRRGAEGVGAGRGHVGQLVAEEGEQQRHGQRRRRDGSQPPRAAAAERGVAHGALR
jgi:hypothetical protein